MADMETLGILDEIQALVSDKLQVVSYKWLSRNFLVSSNTAKRLLQEFVEKNESSQLEVVYSLSGWLKNNPSAYHIKLVLGSKLSEAKEEFGDGCSVQVYSVQASIPKDPAVLWNTEYIQAEELFKEPPDVVNCLRDNRFCGVANSYVKRNGEGPTASNAVPLFKKAAIGGPSRTTTSKQSSETSLHQQKKVDQSNPEPKEDQTKSHEPQAQKPVAQKEQVPPNKKRNQNEKSTSGTSGSIASMWGRASSKPKPDSASIKLDNAVHISNDAQVRANELVEDDSSGDEADRMKFKRVSNGGEGNNRKRRVVLDYSDEDEDEAKDAVNLASPDPPKKQVSVDLKKNNKILSLENKNLDFDEEKEKVEKEKSTVIEKFEKEKSTVIEKFEKEKSTVKEESAAKKRGVSASNENQCPEKGDANKKDAQNAVKKRKVLKTRIDERGREVTEVVWEDDEKETKPDDNTTKDKVDCNATNNAVNRPPAAAPKKSPAVGNPSSHGTGKAGNKKPGTKDPKQGNIMSFFKKV